VITTVLMLEAAKLKLPSFRFRTAMLSTRAAGSLPHRE
jgi:hypothetical protein